MGDLFLPRGYDFPEEERRLAERSPDRSFLTDHEVSCYRAVRRRAPAYLRFLEPDRTNETRIAAAFAVACFAQSLSSAHDEVACLVARDADEAVSASLTICLGMLGRYSESKPSVDFLANRLSPERSPTERIAAAIAVATSLGEEAPEAAYRTLQQALTETWTFPSEVRRLPWNEGDLLGYAALALRLAGSERRDDNARALCSAIGSGSTGTFAIPQTLLDLLFPDQAPFQCRPVAEFDDVQRTSLAVLLRSDQWRSWMIDRRFLPQGLVGDAYAKALNDFVREVTGHQGEPVADLLARFGNAPSRDRK